MSNKVKTSTRLWSQEVAIANAGSNLETVRPGSEGIESLLSRKEIGYEFSNGRKFVDGPGKTQP